MKRIILISTVLLSTQVLADENHKSPKAKIDAEKVVPTTSAMLSNEIKVKVNGMVCAFCAQGIEKKFKAQKEVESVQVSLENKFVKLKFKNGQRLSNEKIAIILKEAGYDANFGE